MRNDYHYEKPDSVYINKYLNFFESQIETFLVEILGYPKEIKYHVSAISIIDIVIRVDKRKAYFHIFHTMSINEYKTAGLFAYWILKLRPITIIDDRYNKNIKDCFVNELFALYIIWVVLYKMGRCSTEIIGNEEYFEELKYSFRFRNFTIDSMMVLIDSINIQNAK